MTQLHLFSHHITGHVKHNLGVGDAANQSEFVQIVWIYSLQKQFDSSQALFLKDIVLVDKVLKVGELREAVN